MGGTKKNLTDLMNGRTLSVPISIDRRHIHIRERIHPVNVKGSARDDPITKYKTIDLIFQTLNAGLFVFCFASNNVRRRGKGQGLTPIITVIENPKKIFGILGYIIPLVFLTLILTPLGFPYSGDISSPRPQRYMILHTQRTFHNRHGHEIGSESGYWIADHDFNSPHTTIPYVPELSYAKLVDRECEKHLYCGFPYLMPVLSFIRKTHWIVSNPPKTDIATNVKIVSRTRLGGDIERVNLEIDGPDHMGLVISPKPGVRFHRWSLNDHEPVRGPRWNGQETYFVYYASSSGSQTWEIYVDFKVPKCNDTIMDVAVISHYLHGPRKNDVAFKRMLAQFPPWTAVSSWTATYKSYVV